MTELSISPLAWRIAEENNVNWRALEGSDAGGGINERDVLNYLEGVMLGSRPVDPTPEPLPEGMTSWGEAPSYADQARIVASNVADTATPDTHTPPPATIQTEPGGAEFEDTYRELFAELGALKKAAANVEKERRKEREKAAQTHAEVQLELGRAREALTDQENELTRLRTQITGLEADVKTREQHAHEAQLELRRLHETITLKDEELAQVHALNQQVEALKMQLGGAEAQASAAQDLAERLARAENASQTAQAEAERLRTAHEGLERTIAELRAAALESPGFREPEKRPWWKLWS